MNLSTSHKYLLLTALYFSQGLPFGFFDKALPVIARSQGVSLELIGMLSALSLPWALKFLWAPIVDKYYDPRIGRRRTWLIPIQCTAVFLMLVVSTLNPTTQFHWVLLAVFLVNLLAATQDIATDGMAIKLLTESERGFGNGIQVAAYRSGMVIGGGVLLIFIDDIGWQLTFQLMAGMLLLASLPVLFTKEPTESAAAKVHPADLKRKRPSRAELWQTIREPLISFLKHPGVLLWLGFIIVYKVGDGISSGMVKPMIYDAGYDKADIGLLLGIAGSVAGLCGALFGGWLCTRLGVQKVLPLFIALQAGAAALYGLIPLGLDGWNSILVLMSVEHVISGMHTAAMFTLMMAGVRPGNEGSDYTIQASMFVVGGGIGFFISGFIASIFGYTFVHTFGACLIALTLVPLFWMKRHGGFRALRNQSGHEPA